MLVSDLGYIPSVSVLRKRRLHARREEGTHLTGDVRPAVASESFRDAESPNLEGHIQEIVICICVVSCIMLGQRVWIIAMVVVGKRRMLDIAGVLGGVERCKGSAATLHRALQIDFCPLTI